MTSSCDVYIFPFSFSFIIFHISVHERNINWARFIIPFCNILVLVIFWLLWLNERALLSVMPKFHWISWMIDAIYTVGFPDSFVVISTVKWVWYNTHQYINGAAVKWIRVDGKLIGSRLSVVFLHVPFIVQSYFQIRHYTSSTKANLNDTSYVEYAEYNIRFIQIRSMGCINGKYPIP